MTIHTLHPTPYGHPTITADPQSAAAHRAPCAGRAFPGCSGCLPRPVPVLREGLCVHMIATADETRGYPPASGDPPMSAHAQRRAGAGPNEPAVGRCFLPSFLLQAASLR